MGALRDGAAARRASGAWGRCKAARGCGIGEWGWWGDWGACWGLVGVRTAHLAPISCRGGVAATSCEKARQRAPTPPNARAPRARRSLGRPDAAQQRPRAPGGVKRALSTCTRPLHAPTAYANAPPSTPPPPVERACARSSARAPRASPALRPVLPGTRPRKRRRGPFGPEVEKSKPRNAFGKEAMPRKPFARGAAQADRHRHLRRRSAISTRPGSCRAAETCARSGGGPERVRKDGARIFM